MGEFAVGGLHLLKLPDFDHGRLCQDREGKEVSASNATMRQGCAVWSSRQPHFTYHSHPPDFDYRGLHGVLYGRKTSSRSDFSTTKATVRDMHAMTDRRDRQHDDGCRAAREARHGTVSLVTAVKSEMGRRRFAF